MSGPSCVPTPPNRSRISTDHALFGSLVLQLYAASGFGSYLIAQNLDVPGFNGSVNPSARNTAIEALNLYWISLGLNLAWSPLFFGLQQPLVALVDIVALTGVVGALTVKAHQLPTIKNLPTSLFFAPYLGASSYRASFSSQISTAADPVCRFFRMLQDGSDTRRTSTLLTTLRTTRSPAPEGPPSPFKNPLPSTLLSALCF